MLLSSSVFIGLDKQNLCQSVKLLIFYYQSISFNMCFGCSKEPSHREGSFEYHLIERVLLSTHNICFGGEIWKLIFDSTLI